MSEVFEPKVVGFLCNWCSYAGADMTGTSRIPYPPNIRIIRVPCSGRVDPLYVLKAFQEGADGVLVAGCHPGDCHYGDGNYHARRRYALMHNFLDFVGIEAGRRLGLGCRRHLVCPGCDRLDRSGTSAWAVDRAAG